MITMAFELLDSSISLSTRCLPSLDKFARGICIGVCMLLAFTRHHDQGPCMAFFSAASHEDIQTHDAMLRCHPYLWHSLVGSQQLVGNPLLTVQSKVHPCFGPYSIIIR